MPRNNMRSRFSIAAIAIAAVVALVASCAAAGEGQTAVPDAAAVRNLLERLDSDRFEIRSRAAETLQSWLTRDDAAAIAAELRRAAGEAELSLEVRSQLRVWLKRFPAEESQQPKPETSLGELIERAMSDSYDSRAAAIEQLTRLASDPAAAVELLTQVRDRLADTSLPASDYRRLLAVYERARSAWLLSDPAGWKMPPVTDEQIRKAVQALVQPPPTWHRYGAWRPHAAARRWLLDALCQDQCVERIKAALETQLEANGLEDAARRRLQEVLDWTRPALVAEIWRNREQLTEQHLLVDVPNQSSLATRPSHFSRIDDRTATCVSGQNLTPGEYPVGIAIAHPSEPNWMCHLVNLPTPRRRMRYLYEAQRDEKQRLAELTERTLKAYTARRQYLTGLQILLLDELDPATVSRLVGDYFLAVEDRMPDGIVQDLGGPHVSHHGCICYMLCRMGTRDIAPRLLQALEKDRFLRPVPGGSYAHWPWVAAVMIAQRDPWPDVDSWLAGLVDRRDLLIPADRDSVAAGTESQLPELGATAAAILLARHDESPAAFGLVDAEAESLQGMGCPAYCFSTQDGRREVQRWWQTLQQRQAQQQKAP